MTEINKINITPDGGVMKEILQDGTSNETPQTGCRVSLHYTGKLTDGTIFDSSVQRGEPFEFELGKGQVIKGFELGVPTMKIGEKCNLICASDYAYGASGSPPSIPPNATLIFELELLGVKGEDLSPNSDGSIERIILEPSNKKRSPNDGAKVKVHLTGKFNDNVFEDREVEFDYGEGSDCDVIEGVEIALEKMTVGETSKIKIKPNYAFGVRGNEKYNIPPHATVEYIVKLLECEKGVDEWKLSDSDRVEQAKIKKEKGTAYFKKNNYELAIKMYNKAVDLLNDDENESYKSMKELKEAAYCNQALCYQKLNDQFEAKQACNKTLKLNPKNIKALFRRGQCNLTINEFDDALDDFKKVIELEPTNKAAQNQIKICMYKIKEAKDKERKIYAQMVSKLGVSDNEPVNNNEPDVLATCGEWTEEEAKREADRAFERDNNIVMI